MTAKKHSIDHDLIRELAGLLKETELTEIEIETEGLRLRVARNVTASYPVAMPVAASAPAAVEGARQGVASAEPANHPGTVTSPMVGTAYRAPEPGARAFVEVGDAVAEGQTLLIIEAMKTMNQIASTRAGRIVRILFEDGQPVEYGQPLLIVE